MRSFLSCSGSPTQDSHELVDVVRSSVGELALQVTPDPLVGVQLGRVTGEELAVPSGVALEDLIDLLAFRGGSRVPKKDDRATEMAKEETEKDGDFRLADVAGVEMEIQPQALAPRTDRHRRDGRDLVVLVAMAEEGRLSPGCPRAPEGRNQEKAALVQEGQMGVQALAFFLGRTTDTAPLGDRRLIGFDRSAFGFLARPMEPGQESSHVGPMKAYAELAPDHLGNAGRGPEIGGITPGQGTLAQQGGQPPNLPSLQPGRPSRCWLGLQAGGPPSSKHPPPQNHRAVRAADPPGHLGDRCPLLQNLDRTSSPSLQLLGTTMRSHTPMVHGKGSQCLLFMHSSINIDK